MSVRFMSSVSARTLMLAVLAAPPIILLPSVASAASSAPPQISSVDRNGVDLIAGQMTVSTPDLTIGGPRSGLARIGTNSFTPYGDNYFGVINFDDNNDAYDVSFNGQTEAFDTTTFLPKTGSPNTLVHSGSTWTYTLGDGTVVTFDGTLHSSIGIQASNATITSITKPDGEVITFTYHSFTNTTTKPQTVTRYLLSVSSTLGWMLKYHTSGDSSSNYPPVKIEAINTSVDYCDPTAMTCGTESQTWPAVQLASDGPTDALGHKTTYTGGMSAPTSLVSPLGATKSITYYTSGTFMGYIQTLSVGSSTWTYNYSEVGSFGNYTQTTTVTNPDGSTHSLVTNTGTGQILSETDELGRTTTYTYYTTTGSGAFNGALYQIIAPDATYSGSTPTGGYVQYAYDSRGNPTTETVVPKAGSGLSNLVTTSTYPSTCSNIKTCNQPTAVVDANGVETDYTYDANSGNVASITAPVVGSAASQIRYTYTQQTPYIKNSSGTLVASTPVWRLTGISECRTGTAPTCVGTTDEQKTTISYGTNNVLPTTVTKMLGDGSLSMSSTSTYDVFGNLTSVDGPIPGTDDTTYYFYDALNRRVGEIDADPDGSGPLQRQATITTFNADGVVSNVAHGSTAGTTATALAGMTVLDSVSYGFDPSSGLPTTQSYYTGISTTPQNVTQLTYDARYRVSCSAERLNPSIFSSLPSSACTLGTVGSDGPDRITKFTYDFTGVLTKITAAYGTAQQADSVTQAINATTGTISTATDANGNVTTYTYDGLDRLVRQCMPSAANGAVSSSTDCTQLGYSGARQSSVTLRDSVVLSLNYDAAGRLSSRTGSGVSESFTRDNFGQITSHTNNGVTETYTYNALGELTFDVQAAGTINYSYDAYGRRSAITYPSYAANSFSVAYGYRDDSSISAETVSYAGAAVTTIGATEDSYGRPTGLTFGSGPSVSTSYGYDASSRLQTLANNLAGSSYNNTVTLGHSLNNLINSRSNSNSAFDVGAPNASSTLTNNGLNQVSSFNSTGLSYDAHANLSFDGAVTYTYNEDNLLTGTSSGASLTYDAENRLQSITKAGATTQFLYDGADLIAEYNGAGALLRRYVHGSKVDQPVVWYEGTDASQPHYLVADERGSIVNVTDGSGNNLTINSYDPYGLPSAGNSGRFQYTGQAYLSEVGLYYYKARLYSPTLGRFMQPDPTGYGDGMNMYSYVHDNPVNAIDPSGLLTCLQGQDCGVTVVTLCPRGWECFSGSGSGPGGGTPSKAQTNAPTVKPATASITTVIIKAKKWKINGPDGASGNHGQTFNPSCQEAAAWLGWVIGKANNAPNTAIGLLWGGVNVLAGDIEGKDTSIQYGNNAIQIMNAPLEASGRAVTLGNVQVYPVGDGPDAVMARSYSATNVNVGEHEEGHTHQGEWLGAAYLPAEALGSMYGDKNPMEVGADKYAKGTSCSGF